jgi:hypothetical protein
MFKRPTNSVIATIPKNRAPINQARQPARAAAIFESRYAAHPIGALPPMMIKP